MAGDDFVVDKAVVALGITAVVGGTVQRPNDVLAYVSGDLIASTTVGANVTPIAFAAVRANGKTGMIRRVRLKVNDAAWAAATVRVHFYKDSPVCTNGDNGAWLTTESNYIGSVDVTFNRTFSDPFVKGIGVPNDGTEINFDITAGSMNLYALLETRSAVTPAASKVFSVAVEVLQN